MKSLRRFYHKDADYFVTVVTHDRRAILLKHPEFFLYSWKQPNPAAWVLMSDHFHAIVNVGDSDISTIMHRFKITYSKRYRMRHNSGRVWQNRFWDHLIRDQRDLNHHLDYIHYNPVNHGSCDDPFAYPHSSLPTFLERGMYERNWGVGRQVEFSGEYGE